MSDPYTLRLYGNVMVTRWHSASSPTIAARYMADLRAAKNSLHGAPMVGIGVFPDGFTPPDEATQQALKPHREEFESSVNSIHFIFEPPLPGAPPATPVWSLRITRMLSWMTRFLPMLKTRRSMSVAEALRDSRVRSSLPDSVVVAHAIRDGMIQSGPDIKTKESVRP